MYRRDYILRLIERFARALIAIRNRLLKRAADAADARAEIHEIARTSGIDLEIAKQLDPVTLLVWLAPGDDVDEAKLWLTAELLYLEDVPPRVSIQEAILLAEKYGTAESPRFVNGVLDALMRRTGSAAGTAGPGEAR